MHNTDICTLTRDAINGKISDLDEKIQILMSSIDNKYNIELKTHKRLIEETTHNMYDVLKEQQKDIDRLVGKIDNIETEYVHVTDLKEKISHVYKDISNIENSIKDIHIMDKNIDMSKSDIDNISKYLNDLKDDLSSLESKLNKLSGIINNDMRMIPAMSKMYDKIIKYKYIIIGVIVSLIILTHGMIDPKSITTILHFIGL